MKRTALKRKVSRFLSAGRSFLALDIVLGGSVIATQAQVVISGREPEIGRSNTFSADPHVPRPDTRPCSVFLFTNLEFADFNTKNFTYTPPSGCPGPWAKVIFKADFTVTAGRQFDRTAQFFIGGANIFFGTTAEPRKVLSPSWHVENDITDLSATLSSSQAGTAILGNFIGTSNGVDYTGIIYSTAQLVFFPASSTVPAPKVPDVVIGIPGNSGAGTLNSTSSQITQSVTLPTNVEKAYLDVIAQSQSNDEFWYLCVPDALASQLQSCGSTGFRETEISIDGVPAGVAPVYPWIYTGGIDVYLWEPIPGVQTLNFKPFRVDISPFAGLLSNGQPHTIGISVFNANGYFQATGNLLAYTDKGSKQVFGQVLKNTLTAPTPVVTNKIVTDTSGSVTGSVKVASQRQYEILGNLRTSHGYVYTRVDANLTFANTQNFVINSAAYKQDLVQSTTGNVSTTTTDSGVTKVDEQMFFYPFTFNYDQVVNNDGTVTVGNKSDQKYQVTTKTFYPPQTWKSTTLTSTGNPAPFVQVVSNEVASADDLFYDSNFNFTGHAGQASQTYVGQDSTGYCYSQSVTAKNTAITGYTVGAACTTPNAAK